MSKDTLATEIALLKQSQQNTMIQLDEFKKTELTHHEELKELIIEIKREVKESLSTKADKVEVDRIRALINGAGVVVGMGIIGYIGTQLIKLIEL